MAARVPPPAFASAAACGAVTGFDPPEGAPE
jgi:hypothetical protein